MLNTIMTYIVEFGINHLFIFTIIIVFFILIVSTIIQNYINPNYFHEMALEEQRKKELIEIDKIDKIEKEKKIKLDYDIALKGGDKNEALKAGRIYYSSFLLRGKLTPYYEKKIDYDIALNSGDKSEALKAGRIYYAHTRENGNLTIYDEQALTNDLSTMKETN